MKSFKISFFVLLVICKTGVAQNDADFKYRGKRMFVANCSMCHILHKKEIRMGEPLLHIRERRGKEYVYQFVWNNFKLRASGNKTAIKVFNAAQKTQMSAFPNLTKAEIDAICDYIDATEILEY